MRVMYVAPRYHTNQIPIIKGWLEHGHQVCFVSQFAGTSEDYSLLEAEVAGYSKLFELFIRLYRFCFCRKQKTETKEFAVRVKFGLPPYGKAKELINRFCPDMVIVREKSLYNLPFYAHCKKRRIPCILYNQSPLWDMPNDKQGPLRKLSVYFLPKYRITPVMGEKREGMVKTKDAYFVPFVMEPYCSPEEKRHFLNNEVQILCVARYEERKNLITLVEAIGDLASTCRLHLTVIGEMADQGQREYYEQVEQTVKRKAAKEHVTLFTNYNREQVYREYVKADLFVLPSTRERASISQLEAMSCSLPVLCSDKNGSACYVEDGVNGFLFQDNNAEDLRQKLCRMINSRELLLKMGRESYRMTKENYQFDSYYDAIMSVADKEKQ